AQLAYDAAQVEQDEIMAGLPADFWGKDGPGTDRYDDIIDLMSDLDSAVTTIRHPVTKEIVPKDYKAMVMKLRYLTSPDMQAAAEGHNAMLMERQKDMAKSNPEVYERLTYKYGPGKVPRAAFARAMQEWELGAKAAARSPEARASETISTPEGSFFRGQSSGGGGPAAAPGPSMEGGPAGVQAAIQGSAGEPEPQSVVGGEGPPHKTDPAAELQDIMSKVETGEFMPLISGKAVRAGVLDQLIALKEAGRPESEGYALLAREGYEPSAANFRQMAKREDQLAKKAKSEAESKAKHEEQLTKKAEGEAKGKAKKDAAKEEKAKLERAMSWQVLEMEVKEGGKEGKVLSGRNAVLAPMPQRVADLAKKLGITLTEESFQRLLRNAGIKNPEQYWLPPDKGVGSGAHGFDGKPDKSKPKAKTKLKGK
ncbi:MAG: hypothetical protein V3S00_05575, partial [Dehalococcoidia bacterium]